MKPRAKGDIVVNGLRKWIGFLEDNTDMTTQFDDVGASGQYVEFPHGQLTLRTSADDGIIHAIDPAEQC